MEKLAKDVTARLKEQAFCVVFEDDLERREALAAMATKESNPPNGGLVGREALDAMALKIKAPNGALIGDSCNSPGAVQ